MALKFRKNIITVPEISISNSTLSKLQKLAIPLVDDYDSLLSRLADAAILGVLFAKPSQEAPLLSSLTDARHQISDGFADLVDSLSEEDDTADFKVAQRTMTSRVLPSKREVVEDGIYSHHRTELSSRLQCLINAIAEGNLSDVISLVNKSRVSDDVELYLGRKLSPEEGKMFLNATDIVTEDTNLLNAAVLARHLKNIRQAARTMCRASDISGLRNEVAPVIKTVIESL